MRFNFRKVSAIATSVLLTGMTMGLAAASAFPTSFTSATPAIVYGASADPMDQAQATKVSTYLADKVPSSASAPEGSWQVGTSNDKLEIGESIHDIYTFINKDQLPLLADGQIVNEKGTADYEQLFYFGDASSSMVNYTENDDDVVGDFFQIQSGAEIARYVIDFNTNLESDVVLNVLEDVQDEEITMLGKTYTITTATNSSGNQLSLSLMSGAAKATLESGEEQAVGGYTVSAIVSASNQAKFTIDGKVLDKKMNKGDVEPITGTNDYIAVTDISYESFSGGLHQVTFWVGADKIVLKNGSDVEVNGETISDADVTMTYSNTDDIAISDITINMTAEDDLLVPVGGKLSMAPDLDEPQVLVSQNWDIVFDGFKDAKTEAINLKPSESDKQYTLTFTNYEGSEIKLPLVWTNNSGIYPGDDANKRFILAPTSSNITKDDYFILNTADPLLATNNARTYIVEYKGASKVTDSSPKITFDVWGTGDTEVSMATSIATGATLATLRLGGATFTFTNESTCNSNDCNIQLINTDYADGSKTNGTSLTNYIRTKYNTLINITDTNWTENDLNVSLLSIDTNVQGGLDGSWILNISVDDTTRDDDETTLSQQLVRVQLDNGTTSDAVATVLKTPSALWITDNDNNDISMYRTTYGAFITDTDGSDSPASIEITVPESVLEPKVYVTSGAVAGSAGSMVFKDSEKTSWETKNVIIVGGSCINTAAATALGVPTGTCGAAFTSATGVLGSGRYLIQSVADKFTTGKIALVVAGYDKADTVAAVDMLVNKPTTIDTTAGNKYLGTVGAEGTSTISGPL